MSDSSLVCQALIDPIVYRDVRETVVVVFAAGSRSSSLMALLRLGEGVDQTVLGR